MYENAKLNYVSSISYEETMEIAQYLRQILVHSRDKSLMTDVLDNLHVHDSNQFEAIDIMLNMSITGMEAISTKPNIMFSNPIATLNPTTVHQVIDAHISSPVTEQDNYTLEASTYDDDFLMDIEYTTNWQSLPHKPTQNKTPIQETFSETVSTSIRNSPACELSEGYTVEVPTICHSPTRGSLPESTAYLRNLPIVTDSVPDLDLLDDLNFRISKSPSPIRPFQPFNLSERSQTSLQDERYSEIDDMLSEHQTGHNSEQSEPPKTAIGHVLIQRTLTDASRLEYTSYGPEFEAKLLQKPRKWKGRLPQITSGRNIMMTANAQKRMLANQRIQDGQYQNDTSDSEWDDRSPRLFSGHRDGVRYNKEQEIDRVQTRQSPLEDIRPITDSERLRGKDFFESTRNGVIPIDGSNNIFSNFNHDMFDETYHYGSTKGLLQYCSTKPEWEYLRNFYNEIKEGKTKMQIKSFERVIIIATQVLSRETVQQIKAFGSANLYEINKESALSIQIPVEHSDKGNQFSNLFTCNKVLQIFEGKKTKFQWYQRICYADFYTKWEATLETVFKWKDFNAAYKKQLRIDPLLKHHQLEESTVSSNPSEETLATGTLTSLPILTRETTNQNVLQTPKPANSKDTRKSEKRSTRQANTVSKREFAIRYLAKALGIEISQQSTYCDLGKKWKGLMAQFGERIIFLLPTTAHFPGGTTVNKTVSLDGLLHQIPAKDLPILHETLKNLYSILRTKDQYRFLDEILEYGGGNSSSAASKKLFMDFFASLSGSFAVARLQILSLQHTTDINRFSYYASAWKDMANIPPELQIERIRKIMGNEDKRIDEYPINADFQL